MCGHANKTAWSWDGAPGNKNKQSLECEQKENGGVRRGAWILEEYDKGHKNKHKNNNQGQTPDQENKANMTIMYQGLLWRADLHETIDLIDLICCKDIILVDYLF